MDDIIKVVEEISSREVIFTIEDTFDLYDNIDKVLKIVKAEMTTMADGDVMSGSILVQHETSDVFKRISLNITISEQP